MGRNTFTRLARSSSAQGSFEYLLVVGGVVVLMAIAWIGFDSLIPAIVGNDSNPGFCHSVDTANPPAAVGNCINPP